jgi:hypothetical protein
VLVVVTGYIYVGLPFALLLFLILSLSGARWWFRLTEYIYMDSVTFFFFFLLFIVSLGLSFSLLRMLLAFWGRHVDEISVVVLVGTTGYT